MLYYHSIDFLQKHRPDVLYEKCCFQNFRLKKSECGKMRTRKNFSRSEVRKESMFIQKIDVRNLSLIYLFSVIHLYTIRVFRRLKNRHPTFFDNI